jgi:phage head maturation protease
MNFSLAALITAGAVTSSSFGFDLPPIVPPHVAA